MLTSLDKPIASVVVLQEVTELEQRRQTLDVQNERLGEFASVVSHDLRNPPSVAKGYADALDMEYDDDRVDSSGTNSAGWTPSSRTCSRWPARGRRSARPNPSTWSTPASPSSTAVEH